MCITFLDHMASLAPFKDTMKSQIDSVLLWYIASPTDELPNISLLKVMMASENFATWVDNVFTSKQSDLLPTDFHSCLQISEGYLGSYKIFEIL
ncbi:hypothetical protein VP01_2997g2 [Puccinia sorghi]|uniref:Uncharacterized protein n=1 Tax=Puccinia sorghi TaxID=27349 RepID=A0A0L6V0I7_9BASI|nr:hypothetical protein VP01_2997g2 [Puccinia sorghi]